MRNKSAVQSPPRRQRLKQRSAERRDLQKQELRRTILAAAVKLFEEKDGYEHFSLRQVAEAIGYSPTTIYLYFQDKDDLLYHVVLEGFREFGECLQQAYKGQHDPFKRLEAIGVAYLDFALSHRIHYRLMFMQRGDFLRRPPPEGYGTFVDSFGILTQALQECIQTGRMAAGDVRAYGALIWAGVHGITSLCIATSEISEAEVQQLFGLQIQMIRRGLSPAS